MTVLKNVVAAAVLALLAAPVSGAEIAKPAEQNWSFDGIFGRYDRAALQRGFQVYREVCAACHSLSFVYYRHLAALGYNEKEIQAIAASVEVQDGPNDEGQMFTRPGRPSDRFKAPFPNQPAARAANNGALPPDLSVITKARPYGADYVYALMTGYREPPPGVEVPQGMHYNVAFPGQLIAMASQLSEGAVPYQGDVKATVPQMARDVSAFLAWASEPELEDRKRTGFKVMLFLVVLTGVLYALKRQIWSDVH